MQRYGCCSQSFSRNRFALAALVVLTFSASGTVGQPVAAVADTVPTSDVLTPAQWRGVDGSVERALEWLATQQAPDGSFPTARFGQPGVTGLCVLAYLSHGHRPGQGPYGWRLQRAVDYIAKCQKPNGLVAVYAPNTQPITRNVSRMIGGTATYNHGISSLALAEVYATSAGTSDEELAEVIELALGASLEMQGWRKVRDLDHGGWRYIDLLRTDGDPVDSNLSNTVWQMLFFRSAKNAGFDITQQPIDDAVGFIKRCFNPKYDTFVLMPSNHDHRTRGMSGAGVIALALAGDHNSIEAQTAGDWILKNTFEEYNHVVPFGQRGWLDDRYHYGLLYCTIATHQLGGRHWREFFPPTVEVLLENQADDGSWEPESHSSDNIYGNAYTTAMMILALGTPNQLLPVLQR